MITFGIIACIGQKAIDVNVLSGLTYRIRQQWAVVAGANADTGTGNQVAGVISDYRQFRPFSVAMRSFTLPH